VRSMQWQLGILGTISAFAYRHRETKKNLCRGGRSQDFRILTYSQQSGIYIYSGPGSSVGIATDYGLDGSGSNPGRDEIFRPSRPALRSTQPPVKWVPDLSRG